MFLFNFQTLVTRDELTRNFNKQLINPNSDVIYKQNKKNTKYKITYICDIFKHPVKLAETVCFIKIILLRLSAPLIFRNIVSNIQM